MFVARFLVGVEAAHGSVGIAVVVSVFPREMRATLSGAFHLGRPVSAQCYGMATGACWPIFSAGAGPLAGMAPVRPECWRRSTPMVVKESRIAIPLPHSQDTGWRAAARCAASMPAVPVIAAYVAAARSCSSAAPSSSGCRATSNRYYGDGDDKVGGGCHHSASAAAPA